MPRRRRTGRASRFFLCGLVAVLQWCILRAGILTAVSVDAPGGGGGVGDGDLHWLDMDYYQILGLDATRDRSISDTNLRKAYRAQAKRHHPDKIAGNGARGTLSTNGTAMVPPPSEQFQEDINGRFVKIAEAYQVLSDPQKRKEYDQYLAHQTRSRQQKDQRQGHHPQPHKNHRGGVAGDASDTYFAFEPIDPYAIFERVFADFMSQFPSQGPNGMFPDSWDEGFDAALFWESHGSGGRGPVRTRRERTQYVDAFGQTVLRLCETEDFPDGAFRVLIQDLVEEWDPYQRRWVLIPLQPRPMVVQEGRLWRRALQGPGKQSPAHREWLPPGAVLTVGMRLENPPFEATLTSSCELTIRLERNGESDIRWTSGAVVAGTSLGDCGLWLEGHHLVVAPIHSPQYIIWRSSPWRESFEEDNNYPSFVHAARLDDDGCLSVYRLEEPDALWVTLIQATTDVSPLQKLVAKIGGVVLALNEVPVRTICVFSTSPAGCFRFARLLHHYMRKVSEWFDHMAGCFFM